MLMHAIAHGGCTDAVREPALEVDYGRKSPCRTGDSNPRQYCTPPAFQSDAVPYTSEAIPTLTSLSHLNKCPDTNWSESLRGNLST